MPTLRACAALALLSLGACLETAPVDLNGNGNGNDSGTDTSDALADAHLDTFTPELDPTTAPDVPVEVELDEPCLVVAPLRVDFARTAVGTQKAQTLTLHNCGDSGLALDAIALGAGSAPAFSLVPAPRPAALEPGVAHVVQILYTPAPPASIGDALPRRDEGTLVIAADGHTWIVDLFGEALVPSCPSALITVAEGAIVTPGTTLHLGVELDGDATGWQWRVSQPVGSTEVIRPSATQRQVTFTPYVLGAYELELTLFDEVGAACPSTRVQVLVHADAALRVELLWSAVAPPAAPADAHIDLDLHLLHPNAGGYFDDVWDVFWLNENPNWESAGPDDDPALDRDGQGFATTEAIDLWQPRQDHRYCVGVSYYYASPGAATVALATVRVYFDSGLVFEVSAVELVPSDLWEVTCFTLNEAPTLLRDDDGDPRITHDFQVPLGRDVP